MLFTPLRVVLSSIPRKRLLKKLDGKKNTMTPTEVPEETVPKLPSG